MGHPSFHELKSAVLGPSARLREVVVDAPRLANVVARLESDRSEILAAFDVLQENPDRLRQRLAAFRQRASDLLYQAYGVDLGGET